MKYLRSARGIEVHEGRRTNPETGKEERWRTCYLVLQHKGKQYKRAPSTVEPWPVSAGRTVERQRIAAARRELATLRAERDAANRRGETWLPPADREALEREAAADAARAAEDARHVLCFREAVKRFLAEHGESYSRPREVEAAFGRLALAFADRYLDELRRADLFDYERRRRAGEAPFADLGAVGPRPAQVELTLLSALYSFLIEDEERPLANPCARPRRRASRRKAERYRPQHEPVIPSGAALVTLLVSVPDVRGKRSGRSHGAAIDAATWRAFFATAYYTGARPESEVCALRHGDVAFAADTVRTMDNRQALGSLTLAATGGKTEGATRTVPLHPELAPLLAAVMLDAPERAADKSADAHAARVQAWRETPIFRKRPKRPDDAPEAMDRHSYKQAWTSTLAEAAKQHPELRGMWLRDLRKTTRTRLAEARLDPSAINHLLGWSSGAMADRYYVLTDRVARAYVDALCLPTLQQVHQRRTAAETPPMASNA